MAFLRLQLFTLRRTLIAQLLQGLLLGIGVAGGLLGAGGLFIGLGLELGDLVFDGAQTFLTIHRCVQIVRGIARRVRFATGHRRFGLHLVHEFVRRGRVGHHVQHIGHVGTMEALTCQLGHRGLGIIVIAAGLRDLLLQSRLILLGRLKSLRSGIGQALRLLSRLLSGVGGLDGGRNLIVVEIRKLQNRIGKIAAYAGKLGFQLRMIRNLVLIFGDAHRTGLRCGRHHDRHPRSAQHRRGQQHAGDGVCPLNHFP